MHKAQTIILLLNMHENSHIPKEIFFYKHKNQTIQQTAEITEKENIQEKL